jgi:hypothetical protein
MFFRTYLETAGLGDPNGVRTERKQDSPMERLIDIEVRFLGVFDTVMALGGRFGAKDEASRTERSFHVGLRPAKCVQNARQALALDERRWDFRPEVWQDREPHQTLQQRWFAGVHSNIGGGYTEDGLANVPLRWMLKEAEAQGLALDNTFVGAYDAYYQGRKHESRSFKFRVLDRVRRRDGLRPLTGYPPEANLYVHPGVVHRLVSDPNDKRFKQLDRYRPENLRQFLVDRNVDRWLATIFPAGNAPALPPDVRKWLGTV